MQSMLLKVKSFVSSQGGLLPDADLSAYAALMQGTSIPNTSGTDGNSIMYNINDLTSKFLHRTMLLTVLLNANNGQPPLPTGYQRLADCEPFMLVLNNWLIDAIKESSPILLKILDLLGVLPLTVQHLKDYKTGRLIKKLAKGDEPRVASLNPNQLSEIKIKAERLFEKWSSLVLEFEQAQTEEHKREEESKKKRRPSTDPVTSTETPPQLSPLIEESKYAQRIAQIVERSHTGIASSSEATPSGRPLSADDIHKAKKKKMYLEMASASSGSAATNLFKKRSLVQEEIKNQNDDKNNAEIVNVSNQDPGTTAKQSPPITSEPSPLENSSSPKSSQSISSSSQSLQTESARNVSNKDLPDPHNKSQSDVRDEGNGKKTVPPLVKKDLSSFLSSVASSTTLGTNSGTNVNKTRKKKRVSFPEDLNELVQVRIIERLESSDTENGEPTVYHDLHEADRREATFAFDQLSKSIQPDVAWKRPPKLNLPEDLSPAVAIDNEVTRTQDSRIKGTLPSGSGRLIADGNIIIPKIYNTVATLKIPISDATNQAPLIRPVPVNVPTPAKPASSTATQSSPPIDPKLLSFLSSGSDLMKNLLSGK